MDFTPINGLVIRPGIQLMKSDVVSLTNGVVNPEIRCARTPRGPKSASAYDPSKFLSIRGDFRSTTNGASYTAITPHTQQATRFVLRFHPLAKALRR